MRYLVIFLVVAVGMLVGDTIYWKYIEPAPVPVSTCSWNPEVHVQHVWMEDRWVCITPEQAG